VWICDSFVTYSVAIDQSTDVKSISKLVFFFIPDVKYYFQLIEELSDLVLLIEKRSVGDISSEMATLLNKFERLRRKIFGFVTDGAVAMIGRESERERERDAAAKLKKQIEKF
jgi:hypothetical protein